MWALYAFGSALFAGLTAVLAKCSIRKTDSTVATAIRTIVVLIFSWVMVFLAGSQSQLSALSGRTLLFLILSGLATGASWLCYFHALQIGDINKVVPVDKSSTVLTILLAVIFLHESLSLAKGAGVVLIAAGTYLMIEKKQSDGAAKKGAGWLLYAAGSAVFARGPEKELVSLRCRFGHLCKLNLHPGQNRHLRRGVESRHGHPHGRGARDVVDDGLRHRQGREAARGPEERARLHLSVRPCHRRQLALLL